MKNNTSMKIWIFVFLPLWLAGCAARPAEDCQHPGTVEYLMVETVGGIGVFLPPCYDPYGRTRYPALYLLPGADGAPEDWFDGGLADLVNELVLSGKIPPLVIITTEDTYEGLEPARIVDTLIPYMDNHMRVQTGRRYRAIAGSSLGGATAYQLAFQHPELFSSAGVFGNGLVIEQEAQVEAWLGGMPEKIKPRVFLNTGEQDTFMLAQSRALIPLLDKYGIQHVEIFSPGGHSGDYWMGNFPVYLQWLVQDWE
jgi:enterochelin esterase family protein